METVPLAPFKVVIDGIKEAGGYKPQGSGSSRGRVR